MAETVYECMFILDPNRYARDPGGVSGSLASIVEKCHGTMHASRLWAEQKLAYPIGQHRKGVYWLTYFTLEGEQHKTFTRECQLNENILRHLLLKVDPRLAETLIAHAEGRSVEVEEEAATENSDTTKGDAASESAPSESNEEVTASN